MGFRQKFLVKFKPTLLIILFLVSYIVASSIIFLNYSLTYNLAIKETEKTFINLSEKVVTELDSYNNQSENYINLLQQLDFVENRPTLEKEHEILPLFISNIKNKNYIYAIYLGYSNGAFYEIINLNTDKSLVNKFNLPINARWLIIKILDNNEKTRYEISLDENLNQLTSTEKESTYNPTTRPWYKNAVTKNKVIKTEPYLFSNLQKPGVTFAKETYKGSGTVIGLDISLGALENIIKKQELVNNSEVYLYRNNGKMTVFNKFTQNEFNEKELIPDSLLNKFKSKDNEITINGVKYLKSNYLLDSKYGYDEYLTIVSPLEEIIKPYKKEILEIILKSFFVFVVVAIPLILLASRMVTKPIAEISKENLKIKDRKFDEVKPVSSYISEVDGLSKSLVYMSNSIQKYEQDQKELMDAFIKLIASAIDAKSKYTGGHCSRVPELSMMIVKEASKNQNGIFKDFKIENDDQLRELSVASWLHDCGKVVTPEYVVDKATKLETIYNRIHEIRTRFEVIYRDYIIEAYERKINGENQEEVDKWLEQNQKILLKEFDLISKANVGSEFMDDEEIEKIKQIGLRTWTRYFDFTKGLSKDELKRLAKTNISTPQKERLLEDKLFHIIPREDFDYEEYEKKGFTTKVPENLYNLGEIYNLCIKKGTLTAYKNEYSQVLINIINNAKDELVARKIQNPYIKITIFEENENIITTIEDNAGGIKVKPISKIFEPFFTISKKNGSGIGLFMAKLIIEDNFKGKIKAQNIDNGAKFTITIPKQ